MTKRTLSQYISLRRRYSRSVNVERDLEIPSALEGYVLTDRSVDSLRRIVTRFSQGEGNRAWTLTSVYGTGKSAFAHYLSALVAPASDPMREKALEIAEERLGIESPDYQMLQANLPEQGFFRAVATGTREPISQTIVRGLINGAEVFWKHQKGQKPKVYRELVDLQIEISEGRTLSNQEALQLVKKVAKVAKSGIFIVLDELGKNLEYAAYQGGTEDLYLLQQLVELPEQTDTQIYLLGILHQAFAEYGQRLATVERNEWAKIQGRFEDIPFTESAGQMMRLIARAIDHSEAEPISCALNSYAQEWSTHIQDTIPGEEFSPEIISEVYPLHPLAAFVLPILCHRYAQNDRSLFTFLTSAEPYSFKRFLDDVSVQSDVLPTLKLDQVYDYFIEAAGMGLASRPNLQRWVEIQDLIADAKHLDADYVKTLKTIGILNLVTVTGELRATRHLVPLALCDLPSDVEEAEANTQTQYWNSIIEQLLQKNLVTHRRQLNELRLWQGSDFNVDSELSAYLEREQSDLVKLLSSLRPLNPLVAQRHSYKTGTLRYFECHYLDGSFDLTQLSCSSSDCDGLVGYWLDPEMPSEIPASTADGKPLILLGTKKLDVLRMRSREYAALKNIQSNAPELLTDGVARREVRYRVQEAEQLLDDTLNLAFKIADRSNLCWVQGEVSPLDRVTDFNAKLSEVCDRAYPKTPILWNELINRRQLTSQGAKARRELLEAMIERSDQEKLGLTGYGPEVSMYYSLLGETGIHRQEDEEWAFFPPEDQATVGNLWCAIEEFCLEATEKIQPLDQLYAKLAAPPYGVKQGAVPVLLAAVLLYHVDDVGVYKDGTFIPVLGSEHFELLVRNPSRFAVKHFEIVGLRSQVFKELEAILRQPKKRKAGKLRNATLLTVVTPLYQFVKKLPAYTRNTKRISPEAQAVLNALQKTIEPDELLFHSLPGAFNLPPIGTGEADDGTVAKQLRSQLIQVLREINTAYEELLKQCQNLLHAGFGVSSSDTKVREELRVRAYPLVGKCVEPTLRSFTKAAVDEQKSDHDWLEAMVMIIADKPAESWTDQDATNFEVKLSDLARRFKNLEALQKDVDAKGEGFEARRVTVTRSDGEETHRLVYVDHEQTDQVDKLVQEVLEKPPLKDNPQLQQAFVAKLTEKVLGEKPPENVNFSKKRKNSENDKSQSAS
jgi:hypothetical protein